MDQFIIGIFGPFILIAMILVAFATMVGVNPESLLKPFFGMVGSILKSLISLFALGLRLTLQGSGRKDTFIKPFKFPDSGGKGSDDDDPDIRIVESDN
jgi:hypothetical protein